MNSSLKISFGQYSEKGRKPINQDFHGIYIPKAPLLVTKGIAVALADGISSSEVSQEASQTAVTSFFEDYYSTTESWSVKKSTHCVLNAVNSWLYSQTRRSVHRYNSDKGYVCTFSGMIIKSTKVHIVHAGDSRIYQINESGVQKLTKEHREYVSNTHYLQRALGAHDFLRFDYAEYNVEVGTTFLLTTDGVYEFISDEHIESIYQENRDNLDQAAKNIVKLAYQNGSDDNLTAQIVRVESLPNVAANEMYPVLNHLPFSETLKPRSCFDGFHIVRSTYHSTRSHVYLAIDSDTQEQVAIKIPSKETQSNKGHLERFLIEEWIARRINSPHVIRPCELSRKKNYVYIATEYIEGQTLTQWIIDNPKLSLEQVREIIEQIAKGLLAFHRLEMLHQDLRPENIMIDYTGTVKIIDFGSTWVAGLEEISSSVSRTDILGTAQFTAPEYFIGECGTSISDQFSLAVIAYQMLSGRLPYGTEVAKARTRSAQKRLKYRTVLDEDREIPTWVDFALRKALNPDPSKRYEVISEFLYDLRHPNKAFANQARAPLIQRNPTAVWQAISAVLVLIIIVLLYNR